MCAQSRLLARQVFARQSAFEEQHVSSHRPSAVRRQAGEARSRLRPQTPGVDRRRVRRDDRDHAVPVPGLELSNARQVQGHDHGRCHRGDRARRNDRHHGGASPRRRTRHGVHQERRRRSGGRSGTRRHGSSAGHHLRWRTHPLRQQRCALERPLHRGQRQSSRRFPRQRRRRSAGQSADSPVVQHDGRSGRQGHAPVQPRPRHLPPEPVARGHRGTEGRRYRAQPDRPERTVRRGALRARVQPVAPVRRRGRRSGSLGARHRPRRHDTHVVPRRPRPAGRCGGAPPPDPKLYATYDGSQGKPRSAAMGTEKGLVGKVKDALDPETP